MAYSLFLVNHSTTNSTTIDKMVYQESNEKGLTKVQSPFAMQEKNRIIDGTPAEKMIIWPKAIRIWVPIIPNKSLNCMQPHRPGLSFLFLPNFPASISGKKSKLW